MERASKSLPTNVSRHSALVPKEGPVTWEYRFSHESPADGEAITNEGWIVASTSTGRDQRREYLLKRPRR